MTPELHDKILGILARHNNMSIATLRPDGFPQVTTVSYANDGLKVYFGCGSDSQKAHNLGRDPRVSAAIDEDHANWNEIEGISLAGTAARVTDPAEFDRIGRLFRTKFPQMEAFGPGDDTFDLTLFRVSPSVISVLDYTKGFGHTELVHIVAQS